MESRSEHQRLTERWLRQVIERNPASLSDWRAGKVCQVCGDIATVSTWEEWVAAHSEGGEFVGFRKGHIWCTAVPPGALAERPSRYCEICQQELPHERDRRIDLSWICESCERRVRERGHDLESVLAELSKLRFGHYESNPARSDDEEVDDSDWPLEGRLEPPVGWLPPGLYRCGQCGEIRGTTWTNDGEGGVETIESTCICEGIPCRNCGRQNVHRPISDYYDPTDGHFWHVPYFAGMTCPECANG